MPVLLLETQGPISHDPQDLQSIDLVPWCWPVFVFIVSSFSELGLLSFGCVEYASYLSKFLTVSLLSLPFCVAKHSTLEKLKQSRWENEINV